jgi:putative alpha-1,2-mannosidase
MGGYYKGVTQLLALLFPQETSDLVQTLVSDAELCGAFPKQLYSNLTAHFMEGESMTSIASAYAFGATHFDRQKALEILRNTSEFSPGCDGQQITDRPFYLPQIDQVLGYMPSDLTKVTPPVSHRSPGSASLEFANRDFAAAQFAKSLGDSYLERRFMRSAAYWRNQLTTNPNSNSLLFQARNIDGSWDYDTGSTAFAEAYAEQDTYGG